ncbi:MAG: RNA polymerase sigma factor [Chitinophagales bacterium]
MKLFKVEVTKEQGFNLLVKTYSEKLYWQIRRMVFLHEDADDVLQNVFIKVWRYLDNFKEDAALHTWLYRIAYNESISFLRKNNKHLVVEDQEASAYLTEQIKADPYFDGDKLELKLQEAIAALPPKQRMVFILKYYDEMPYNEMSNVLETSEGALKASYHHAVKKIEAFFKED